MLASMPKGKIARAASAEAEQENMVADEVEAEVLTTEELARLKKVSVATVDRARRSGALPAELRGRQWVFRKTVLEMELRRQGVHTSAITQVNHAGIAAQQIFELLDKKMPTREIVQRLALHPATVLAVAKDWIACGAFNQNELAVIHGDKALPVLVPSWAPPSSIPPPDTGAEPPNIPSTPPIDIPSEPPRKVEDIISDMRKRMGIPQSE